MRDHEPIILENFKGLWSRGSTLDGCPKDHFTDCNNIDFDEDNIIVRPRFNDYFSPTIPGTISSAVIVRQQVFNTIVAGVNTSFFLCLNRDEQFFAIKFLPATAIAVLLKDFGGATGIRDFDFVNIGNRAFITFSNGRVGLDVLYRWDGTTFIEAAGVGPTASGGQPTVANSATAGNVQAGIHYFSYAFEYGSGFISTFKNLTGTAGVPLGVNAPGNKKIDLAVIPLGGTDVVARWILATKVIPNGNLATDFSGQSNEFFFLQRIADNTTAAITVNFYDNQLTNSADYLYDITEAIQGGVCIALYHGRLVLGGMGGFAHIPGATSLSIIVSFPNDPETFDLVTSLIDVQQFSQSNLISSAGAPLDVGVVELQEYRDVLYTWSVSKTAAIVDNGDTPDTWTPTVIDDGVGSFPHGVVTVLDAGSANINYLITGDKTGLYVFNGNYVKPELSWKIATLWKLINKTPDTSNKLKGLMSFVNDTFNKKFYILLSFDDTETQPSEVLLCDYSLVDVNDAAAYTQIRFARWRLNNSSLKPTSLFLYDSGAGVRIFCNDSLQFIFYWLNGPVGVTEIISSPYIQTALLNDGADRNVLHFGSIRLRINGNGVATQVLTFTITNEDSTRSVTLATYTLPIASLGKEPTLLANFVAQQAFIKMSVPNNGYFILTRLTSYIKPIYSELPQ